MSGALDAILELGDFPYTPPIAPGDPYFNYVASLLHFNDADGTTIPVDVIPGVIWLNDGANPNPTDRAIVKNTNPKFGTGSLERPNTSLAGGIHTSFSGAGAIIRSTTPFTIEFWVYFTQFSLDWIGNHNSNRLCILAGTNKKIIINVFDTSGNVLVGEFDASGTGTTAVTKNAWHFIAIASDGSTTRVFLDGHLEFSFASQDITGPATGFNYSPARAYSFNGDFWIGYTDEARLTVGVCRYTSNFAPPTQEFPNGPVIPIPPSSSVVFPTTGGILNSEGNATTNASSIASLTFNRNGTVNWVGNKLTSGIPPNVNSLANTFNWFYPNQIDTGTTYPGDSYWIRCVPVSGGVPGITSWTPLTSSVTFQLENTTASSVTEQFDIQIASDSFGSTIVCNSTGWQFVSVTVSGDSTGTHTFGGTYTTKAYHIASTQVALNSNGTGLISKSADFGYPSYVFATDTFNWYTPTTTGIGANYWAKITVIFGSLTLNNSTSIINIAQSVPAASLNNTTSGTTATCQFRIDIYSDAGGTTLVSTGLFTFNSIVAVVPTPVHYFGPTPIGSWSVGGYTYVANSMVFKTDGTYEIHYTKYDTTLDDYIDNIQTKGYWYSPTTYNIGNSYYIKVTNKGPASLTQNDCSSVVHLNVDRTVKLSSSIPGTTYATFDVAIYSDSGGTTRVNSTAPHACDITLQCVVEAGSPPTA